MIHSKHLTLWTLATVLSASAFAQTPVKSVDEDGNVTYSDNPVTDAVSATVVPIAPGPDPDQVKEAQKQLEKVREQADAAEKSRKETEAERRAKKEAAAQRKATETKVIVIQEDHGGYPVYNNPPLIRPPVRPRPPGSGSDHPAYTPPSGPVVRPLPSPR